MPHIIPVYCLEVEAEGSFYKLSLTHNSQSSEHWVSVKRATGLSVKELQSLKKYPNNFSEVVEYLSPKLPRTTIYSQQEVDEIVAELKEGNERLTNDLHEDFKNLVSTLVNSKSEYIKGLEKKIESLEKKVENLEEKIKNS